MAEDTPPWLIEQGDYIYESIELLLPVFHKVKFSPLQSARVSTLVKLCSKKIVADSSMCQQARFLLPATLIEGLVREALLKSRDRALVQLMRGWRYPTLVLKDLLPDLFRGERLFLDYEKKRATAILADKCVKNLLYAIKDKGFGGLKHLDLTGFPSLLSVKVPRVQDPDPDQGTYFYSDIISDLRSRGLRVTLDTGAGYYSYLTNADSLNSSRGVYVQDLITTDLAAIITDQHLNPDLVKRLSVTCDGAYKEGTLERLLGKVGSLEAFTSVEHLNFSSLKLGTFRRIDQTSEDAVTVMRAVGRLFGIMSRLTRLDLQSSIINQGGGMALLSENLLQLEYLNVSFNPLSIPDVQSLSRLGRLQHLDVSGCKTEAAAESEFRKVLPSLPNLEVLQIGSATKLCPESSKEIFIQTLRRCTKLDALSIHFEIDFDELIDSLCPLVLKWIKMKNRNNNSHNDNPLDLALQDGDGDKLALTVQRGYQLTFTDKFVTALKLGY